MKKLSKNKRRETLSKSHGKNKRKMKSINNEAPTRELSSFKPADQKDILAVRAVLAGRKEEFSCIIDRYRPYVIQRFFLKVKDRDIAEDLASDVLIHVLTKLEKYRECYTFNAWFTRVADNFLVDWSRKAECRLRAVSVSYDKVMSDDEGSVSSFIDAIADVTVASDSKVLNDERLKAIREGLSTVDELGRRLISMFYGKDMSYEEMAAEVGMNINTMKIALMRAKHKLAEYIMRAYPEFEVRSAPAKRFAAAKKDTVVVDGEEHITYYAA